MYIVMNRFTLHPGNAEAFEARWKERESLLGTMAGFLRFRLLRQDETLYSSYVEWESQEHFEAWTQSEAFHKAHARGAPTGVMNGPPRLECWDVVLDQG